MSSTHLAPCSAFDNCKTPQLCTVHGQYDKTCFQRNMIKVRPTSTHVLSQFLVRSGILRKEVVLVRSIALRVRPAAKDSQPDQPGCLYTRRRHVSAHRKPAGSCRATDQPAHIWRESKRMHSIFGIWNTYLEYPKSALPDRAYLNAGSSNRQRSVSSTSSSGSERSTMCVKYLHAHNRAHGRQLHDAVSGTPASASPDHKA